MFGRLKQSSASEPGVSAGPLDRLGRRNIAESRPESSANDRDSRIAAAASSLSEALTPKLRALITNNQPAGEVARQAGQLVQAHFRSQGVMLSPLELRGYV